MIDYQDNTEELIGRIPDLPIPQEEPTQPLPVDKPIEPEITEYTSWWKLLLMFIFGIAVAVGVLFLLSSYGLIPGTIVATYHEQQINQSFNQGYDMGVYDTSKMVINTKQVPIFNEQTDGSFKITYKPIEELLG